MPIFTDGWYWQDQFSNPSIREDLEEENTQTLNVIVCNYWYINFMSADSCFPVGHCEEKNRFHDTSCAPLLHFLYKFVPSSRRLSLNKCWIVSVFIEFVNLHVPGFRVVVYSIFDILPQCRPPRFSIPYH